jgi:hypothetical protein
MGFPLLKRKPNLTKGEFVELFNAMNTLKTRNRKEFGFLLNTDAT